MKAMLRFFVLEIAFEAEVVGRTDAVLDVGAEHQRSVLELVHHVERQLEGEGVGAFVEFEVALDGERLAADWRVTSHRERTGDEIGVEFSPTRHGRIA